MDKTSKLSILFEKNEKIALYYAIMGVRKVPFMAKKESQISRSRSDILVRKYLNKHKEPLEALMDIATIRYCGVSYHPMAYAFVVPYSKLIDHKSHLVKYLFCIYSKVPGKNILFVSNHFYKSIDECKKESMFYLKHFPLFANLKRNIYENDMETPL